MRAFQSLPQVELAIGVDIAPGESNPLVVFGDAHTLNQFKDAAFGSAFSNVLDHILHIDKFAAAVHRVLKQNGTLFVHMPEQPLCKDIWAVNDLADPSSIICKIRAAGFSVLDHIREATYWKGVKEGYTNRYIFRKTANAVSDSNCLSQSLGTIKVDTDAIIATTGDEKARERLFPRKECAQLIRALRSKSN